MSDLDNIIAEALADMQGAAIVEDAPADEAPAAETDTTEAVVEEQSDEEPTEPTDETEGDEEESDDDTDGGPLEVDLDTLIKLPDGRTVSVKDGIELKADYTRKTQELAAQRKEVEQVYTDLLAWRDSVLAQPDAFVAELVQAKAAEPVALASGVLGQSTDPTAALAQVIKHMLDEGMLSDEFVDAFGLDAPDHTVRNISKTAKDNERLERLERELEARRLEEETSKQQAALVSDYERQIDDIIRSEGLDPAGRDELVVELVTFAQESGLVDNLAHAYAVLSYKKVQEEKARAAATAKKAEAKRATRVMAPASASTAAKPVEAESFKDYESASAAALAELTKRWQ